MIKILSILAVFAIIVYILYIFTTKDKMNNKIIIILSIIVASIIYVYTITQQSSKLTHAELKALFNNGKTISCGMKDVNSSNYDFISGTLVFTGKADTKYKGELIKLDSCAKNEQ